MTRQAQAPHTEIELKFLVPAASRAALSAAVASRASRLDHVSLAAAYLDTPDRRLAQAGLAWRLRREGRRWVQTLKAAGSTALERFEHEVIRPNASHDAQVHAGTVPGEKLLAVLRKAQRDGIEPQVRYKTVVRRTVRRMRIRGAVVELAWDEGRLVTATATHPIREIEFELVSGSACAMLALADRWRRRFGLVPDPRSKAERGDRLADGHPFPLVRKARHPGYPRRADARDAFIGVVDECLAHVMHNTIGLIAGDPGLRADHVHQLRVGLRRLRSALRSFRGWLPDAPPELEAGTKAWFTALGACRDADVLADGVAAELARVGAPTLDAPGARPVVDAGEICRSEAAQATLMAWMTWQLTLAEHREDAAARASTQTPEATTDSAEAAPPGPVSAPEPAFEERARRRLRRWHRQIAADWKAFDELDEPALHDLRKRIKRQRYAVEFFSPLLKRRRIEDYLGALAAVQDRMGELNDLFVARTHYQAMLDHAPQAWFALGWLTARISALRAQTRPELGRLARCSPP